ncbi:hypothetical protein CK203_054502 [Vitis vinifera]|uniref:Uncharacterized protein n=1 Tax=Vitis vinifera TaxID=29760 RepID=A0A438GB63_VITVI|nr:hypothetical protein CK203_054502 [Vitis vinifera]
MSGAKGMQGAIEQNKKRRTVNRPCPQLVCLQFAECFEKDVKVECESQHEVLVDKLEEGSQSQEVHYSTSSCVSNVQCVNEDAEAVNEIADSVISSRALQDKDENKAIEEEPILSDLKHSISVEVKLKEWNRDSFGRIELRKMLLWNRYRSGMQGRKLAD